MNRDAETVHAHHETPDVAELRRLAELCTSNPDFPHDGIGSLVRALPVLADRLAHMTEARNNARAEVKRLTAKLDAIEADGDKLSIMFGWLVYDVGEHTCGGYGPESGYAHEPGCGFEPVLRLDKLEGWPGEKPLDGRADS